MSNNYLSGKEIRAIAKENKKGAVDGHKVVVEITDFGKPGRNPEGKVIEILGHVNDPGVDILSLVKENQVNYR